MCFADARLEIAHYTTPLLARKANCPKRRERPLAPRASQCHPETA
jgi:hypothetical protein